MTAATISGLARDDAGDIAAGISYYTFLSVFPLLLGIIGLLGYIFPSTAYQQELLDFVNKYLPISVDLLKQNIPSIIEMRGALSTAGLIGLLWLSTAVFGAIGRAMDRAWGTGRQRPWFVRKVRDISISVLTGILFFISLGLTALTTLVPQVDLPFQTTIPSLTGPALAFIFIFGAFILVYKFMPHAKMTWREAWPGALLASILFEILRGGFSLYLVNFSRFEVVYGAIASIITFLVGIYFSAFVLIIGIEFSSQLSIMKKKEGEKRTSNTVL